MTRLKYQDYSEKKKQLEASNKSDHELETKLNYIGTVNCLKETIDLLEKNAFDSYDKAKKQSPKKRK